jgi:hypothetical protein
MPATPIEFPQSSFPYHFGNQPAESQGRLLNIYVEQEKDQAVYKRKPTSAPIIRAASSKATASSMALTRIV